jgi:hypothetical protein
LWRGAACVATYPTGIRRKGAAGGRSRQPSARHSQHVQVPAMPARLRSHLPCRVSLGGLRGEGFEAGAFIHTDATPA